MRRLAVLAVVVLAACGERDEARGPAARDTVAGGELALPPSAAAPRATQPGRAPDTLTPDEGEAAAPPPTETVGPVPPPVLDVGAIDNAYRRYYRELFLELGSKVRGGVDPELVEEAKRRTALEFAFVDVNAWNDMLSELTAAQRAELAERIAVANSELARDLHSGQITPRG